MKHRVLVVDDDWQERRMAYEGFARTISDLYPGFSVALDFAELPNQVVLKVQHECYSAVIVDAVLEGNWPNYPITSALRDLGTGIPIAIISQRWDATNASQIDEAWKRPNCRTFLHWRDIDPNLDGQVDYAVRSFVGMLADAKRLDRELAIGPNDPVSIIHISDIQTGGFKEESLELESNRCAERIKEQLGDCPPTFIAFTGDVAEFGSPSQYEAAHQWMVYFCDRLGLGSLPARNLLYVPGNHDVNLSLAGASRVIARKGEHQEVELELSVGSVYNDLIGYAYTPFRNFLSGISDCPLLSADCKDQSFAWVEARYRHLGIVFYGVNTAQPANAYGLPGRHVDPKALALIGNNLKVAMCDWEGRPPLVVGLGHHCPVSASGDQAVDNPGDFGKFFLGNPRTGLFLHGHTHLYELEYSSAGGLRIVRSCAPTFTKPEASRPVDTLRGFNLLRLGRTDGFIDTLRGSSFAWTGVDLKEISDKGNSTWVREEDGMFWPERGAGRV